MGKEETGAKTAAPKGSEADEVIGIMEENGELHKEVAKLKEEAAVKDARIKTLEQKLSVGIDIDGDGAADIQVVDPLEEVDPVEFEGFGTKLVTVGENNHISVFFKDGKATVNQRGVIEALDANPKVRRVEVEEEENPRKKKKK